MRFTLPGQLYLPPVNKPFITFLKAASKKIKETVVFTRPVKKRGKKGGIKVAQVKNTIKNINLLRLFFVIFSLITISIFILVMRGVPGNPTPSEINSSLKERSGPFELSPERGRYAILMSLDESKSFALSAELRDVVYPDVGYIDGRNYSFFAPGISLLIYPFYLIGKYFELAQVISFAAISLFALGNMLVLYKISRVIFSLPQWASLFSSVIFAFGSTSLSYANSLYQHHTTTFLILLSFFAVYKYSQKKSYDYLWVSLVWLLYGIGIWIDYPNAILMFPVMIYLLIETLSIQTIRRKILLSFRWSAILTSIVFLILTMLHGYYNYTNFGSPTKVSGSLIGYKAIKELKLLESKKGTEKLKEIENLKQPVGFFKEENFPKGAFILLFDTDRGIFFFSPILILGAMQIIFITRRLNRKYSILIALIGTNIFLYSSFGDPWGGYAYGPRYLIPTMSIFSIFTAEFIYRSRRQLIAKFLAILLFVYSSAISVLGAITTNSVPPKVEALYLKSNYNYLLNIDDVRKNVSSSFLYNSYFSNITVENYFLLIYCLTFILCIGALFVLPILYHHDN